MYFLSMFRWSGGAEVAYRLIPAPEAFPSTSPISAIFIVEDAIFGTSLFLNTIFFQNNDCLSPSYAGHAATRRLLASFGASIKRLL